MNITLCQADGDQSKYESTRETLASFGYEFSDRRCTQVPCGKDPNLTPDHENWDAMIRSIHRAEGDMVYMDWEFPDHIARHKLNTEQQRLTKKQFFEEGRRAGKQMAMWGEPGIYINHKRPMSQTAMYECLKTPTPDFVVTGAYLTKHLDTPREQIMFISNAQWWVNSVRRMSPKPDIYLAFQLVIRPDGQTFVEMNDDEAWLLGRTLAASGANAMWWFENGNNGNHLDAQLRRAERLAPVFLDGWNSIGIAGGTR